MRRETEHYHQCAVIEWARLHETKWPALRLLHAIPNGGARHPAVAAKMKREGVRPGMPDLHLPIAAHGYNGLYIEMKAPSRRSATTTAQREIMALLVDAGHRVEVCDSQDEAIALLRWYVGESP